MDSYQISKSVKILIEFIEDITNCMVQGSSQFEIVINSALIPTFNNIEVCAKSQVQLPTQSIEGYDGTWSPAVIDTSVEGTKVYYFTPNTECGEIGELTVIVKNCFIQKGISPNGDGLNDNWDLSNFDIDKVEIFNRYGTEVYSKRNYTNEWNGRSDNGNELPTATYYYVIFFKNNTTKTGWVYLNREN